MSNEPIQAWRTRRVRNRCDCAAQDEVGWVNRGAITVIKPPYRPPPQSWSLYPKDRRDSSSDDLCTWNPNKRQSFVDHVHGVSQSYTRPQGPGYFSRIASDRGRVREFRHEFPTRLRICNKKESFRQIGHLGNAPAGHIQTRRLLHQPRWVAGASKCNPSDNPS
jgi:hypothetical protein